MTLEDARRFVEVARGYDPETLDAAHLATAIAVLRDRASNLYDETQRESARWLAATADRRCRSLLELSLPIPLAAAVSLTQFAETDPARVRDTSALIRIAGHLLQWVDTMYDGLRHDRARWESASPDVYRRRIEGARLVRQVENGRLSYFLSGKRLWEGVTLWLLTSAGWLPGFFHVWQNEPFFVFRLPGAAEHEMEISIPSRAVLAWSVE
jgi:hypothetical protein